MLNMFTNKAVDKDVEFHGYAAKSAKSGFAPWSYHPRKLGDEDVEIAITHCGICGSDIHYSSGGWGKMQYPIITGHEIVGHVTAAGSKAKFAVGDRVAVGAQCKACYNEKDGKCDGCQQHLEQHCKAVVDTYGGKYDDGEMSQGGYADKVRVDHRFVFKVPDNIASEHAAPLMCAGSTVYTPLRRAKVVSGSKVGVIGVGGLGHLAIQFAAKMGAEVTAIGHSAGKKDDAMKLGAKHYIDSTKDADMEEAKQSLDVVLCTADAKGMPYDKYMSLVRVHGHFVQVAVPEEPVSLSVMNLAKGGINYMGTLTGSLAEIQEMLDFASKNDVRPIVEILPMEQVNEGIRKVKENDVKYRVVLHNDETSRVMKKDDEMHG